MDQLKGWKTAAFVVLTFALGLANLTGFADFQLDDQWQEWYNLLLPLVFLALRHVTDSAAAWRRDA